MLTVWRTLYVEEDRLVAPNPAPIQAAYDLTSSFNTLLPSEEPNRGTILNDRSAPLCPGGEHQPPSSWWGANLTLGFHAQDVYNVLSNACDQVTVQYQQPDMTNGLTPRQIAALPDKSYVVSDEKVAESLGNQTDDSLGVDLFAKAYVRLAVAAQDPPNQVDINFASKRHRNVRDLFDQASFPADKRTATHYWSVSLYGAFEGDAARDRDPRGESGVLGVASVGKVNDLSLKNKSSVLLETIRDFYEKPPAWITINGQQSPLVLSPDIVKRVTAHELLHTMDVRHSGGVMCASNVQDTPAGATLPEEQIRLVRDLERPIMAPDISTCPAISFQE